MQQSPFQTIKQRLTMPPNGIQPALNEVVTLPKLLLPGLVEILPAQGVDLLATGRLQIVDEKSEEIPEKLAHEIAVRNRGGFGEFASKGVAVCHLTEDQNVVIVLIGGNHSKVVINHELIHAAQVWCTNDAQRAAFCAAAEDGRRIAQAVEQLAGLPDDAGEFRDLDWCCKACHAQMPDSERLHHAFDLALKIYPRPPTATVANSVGVTGGDAIVAAVFAHYMVCAGFSDWKSDVAREIVAHRFEAEDSQVIVDLFDSALETLEAGDGLSDSSSHEESMMI